MAYVALYRKWRPQDFTGLIGQDHISRTLKNAIVSGRIAHAYLFSGPRGTGKTTTAKILAKALNCERGPTPEPCNACSNCERINDGSSMDVFEIDAASNRGIDEIRELRETVKFAPVDGRYKVYIIDEVHMLTTEAFNALLKTLEEPPAHVVFILATTEAHKIPATIHSRCQHYDFRRIGPREIVQRLTEVVENTGLEVDPDALKLIAVQAGGGMRDALSILDQCTALDGERVTAQKAREMLGLIGQEWIFKLTGFLADRNGDQILLLLDELLAFGKDARQILSETALHLRSVMLYKAAPGLEQTGLYSDAGPVLKEHAAKLAHGELVEMIRTLHEAVNEAKWSPEPRITAEAALLAICSRGAGDDLAALIKRVEALEKQLQAGGASVRPAAAAPPAPEPPAARRSQGTDRPAATPRPAACAEADCPSMKEVWEKMLQALLTDGKRSVYACVAQGQPVEWADHQLTIGFAAAFPRERTEKPDYREILEGVLQGICKAPVRVRCAAAPEPAAKQPRPPDVKEHPALKAAIEMFGDHIVEPEE